MQKTRPATIRSFASPTQQARSLPRDNASNSANNLLDGANKLMGQIPAQQRLQALNSVVNLASEAMNLYQAHLHLRETEANCECDKHLSDNEVHKHYIALHQMVEVECTKREQNRQDHAYRMTQLTQQGEASAQRMQLAEALISDYRRTRRFEDLAAAMQLLTQHNEV